MNEDALRNEEIERQKRIAALASQAVSKWDAEANYRKSLNELKAIGNAVVALSVIGFFVWVTWLTCTRRQEADAQSRHVWTPAQQMQIEIVHDMNRAASAADARGDSAMSDAYRGAAQITMDRNRD